MINLGLAGPAGCGKDAVAEYLVERYGFISYSFTDALYREVAEAYSLEDESLLRDRATKEVPTDRLAMVRLSDALQFDLGHAIGWDMGSGFGAEPDLQAPLSPRQVLQWWGSEYRRAQDPDYWVSKTDAWLYQISHAGYPEHRPNLFVNTSVRFPNEQEWIHDSAAGVYPEDIPWHGQIWHIHRDGLDAVNAHQSETPLPVLPGERELWNNDTLARLYYGVDLLLTTATPFVKVEPMEKE